MSVATNATMKVPPPWNRNLMSQQRYKCDFVLRYLSATQEMDRWFSMCYYCSCPYLTEHMVSGLHLLQLHLQDLKLQSTGLMALMNRQHWHVEEPGTKWDMFHVWAQIKSTVKHNNVAAKNLSCLTSGEKLFLLYETMETTVTIVIIAPHKM